MAKAKPVVPEELESIFGVGKSSAVGTMRTASAEMRQPVQERAANEHAEVGSPFLVQDSAPLEAVREEIGLAPAANVAPGAIYASLNAVHRELARLGMAKDQRNTTQNFNFRSIDGLYNLVSALLAKNNVLTVPRMNGLKLEPFVTKNGIPMFRATLEAEYKLLSTIDGSSEYLQVMGEGMDSGDKATNKAMSIAHKYALIQLFNIPLVGSDDPDLESPEAEPVSPRKAPRAQVVTEEAPAEAPAVEAAEDPIAAHIATLTSNPENQEVLATKVLQAYGVMTLGQVPEDRIEEAKAHLTSFVAARKKNQAKK